jgi:hypothetical protein
MNTLSNLIQQMNKVIDSIPQAINNDNNSIDLPPKSP